MPRGSPAGFNFISKEFADGPKRNLRSQLQPDDHRYRSKSDPRVILWLRFLMIINLFDAPGEDHRFVFISGVMKRKNPL